MSPGTVEEEAVIESLLEGGERDLTIMGKFSGFRSMLQEIGSSAGRTLGRNFILVVLLVRILNVITCPTFYDIPSNRPRSLADSDRKT